MDIIITRSSNNYGPHQFKEKFIPKIIYNFLIQKPIEVYGDGMQVRDWTYVDDNCKGIYDASRKVKSGETINISAHNEKKNIEIVDLIAKKMDIKFKYLKFIKDRLGHDFRYSIDTTKIRKLG